MESLKQQKLSATILQPTYLPWMGYIEMIDATDLFVIFDHVQFIKKSWHHRNRVKTSNGITWLSVPVAHASQQTKIRDITIAEQQKNELRNHWKTISLAYKSCEYFTQYNNELEQLFNHDYVYLMDLNVAVISFLLKHLGMNKTIIYSSDLNLADEDLGRTEKVINLCKKAGITYLYDAEGAEPLLNINLFKEENITIEFQKYSHPIYKQLWGEFIPFLSTLDVLMNEGDNALSIIRSGNRRKN